MMTVPSLEIIFLGEGTVVNMVVRIVLGGIKMEGPLPFTKFGDKGCTMNALGAKETKTSLRIVAIGDVDELNSVVGMCRETCPVYMHDDLVTLQNILFVLGSDCATPLECPTDFRINETHVKWIENIISKYHIEAPTLKEFVLPNNVFHLARSVARRAERSCWAMHYSSNEFNDICCVFLNRTSDLLFTLARLVGQEVIWDKSVLDMTNENNKIMRDSMRGSKTL